MKSALYDIQTNAAPQRTVSFPQVKQETALRDDEEGSRCAGIQTKTSKEMTYDSWKARNPADEELGNHEQPAFCWLCRQPVDDEGEFWSGLCSECAAQIHKEESGHDQPDP